MTRILSPIDCFLIWRHPLSLIIRPFSTFTRTECSVKTSDGSFQGLLNPLFIKKQWSGGGSNSQPRHCERRALPVELPPRKKKLIPYSSLFGLDRTNRPGGCLAEGMAVYNTESSRTFHFERLFLYVCKPLQSLSVVPESTIFVISLLAFHGADWSAFQESADPASRALHSTRSTQRDSDATLKVFQHLPDSFWGNFHGLMSTV